MKEKDMKNFYQKEHEIPKLVEDKLQEAYREIREDGDKGRKIILFSGLARWKVALVACLCLVLGATAGAAVRHFDGLRLLFGSSIEPIRESVKEVDEDKICNTFPELTVNIEEMAGTDREVYMILNVKRTDGKSFRKGYGYWFEGTKMVGEHDPPDGYSADQISSHEGSWSRILKNEGTDEIKMVLGFSYERREYDYDTHKEKSFYHRGDTCTLSIKNLICDRIFTSEQIAEAKESGREDELMAKRDLHTEMKGEIKTKLKLDYGEAPVRECQPDVKIRLPRMDGSGEYDAAGTVKSIRINPYYMDYTCKFDKLWREDESPAGNLWEEIYLEMEDGTKYGPKTPQEYSRYFYGSMESEDRLAYSTTSTLSFQQVVDVDKIQAVWFGNKRIPLDG